MLAREAFRLIKKIPEYVNTTEYLAVATALDRVHLYDVRDQVLKLATQKVDKTEKWEVWRLWAWLSFNAGSPGYARTLFAYAEHVASSVHLQWAVWDTTYWWGQVELQGARLDAKNCYWAKKQVTALRSSESQMDPQRLQNVHNLEVDFHAKCAQAGSRAAAKPARHY